VPVCYPCSLLTMMVIHSYGHVGRGAQYMHPRGTQRKLRRSNTERFADRERAERRKVIKHKIMAVGRLSRMFSVLRCVTVVLATHSDPPPNKIYRDFLPPWPLQ
jgi:hypothetical protein